MTQLPAHRRLIEGRTHSRSWSPSDSDPIEHHRAHRVGTWAHALVVLAGCVFIGILIVSGL